MERISQIVCALCLGILLSACSSTQTKQGWEDFLAFFSENPEIDPDSIDSLQSISGTKLLLLNTPTIKFYDLAVVRVSYYAINVDLFQMGVPIGTFVITKSDVCFQGECAPKSLMARKIFGEVSYGELFDDIFFGKDIFQSRGIRISRKRVFTQRFVLNKQEILYERTAEYTSFKNLSNGVTITIQDYVPPEMNPPHPRRR